MLVRLVPRTGEVKLLSLPRDLLVEVKPGVKDKINAAYNDGGPRPRRSHLSGAHPHTSRPNARMTSNQLKGTPETLPDEDEVLVPDERANERMLEAFRGDSPAPGQDPEPRPENASECE